MEHEVNHIAVKPKYSSTLCQGIPSWCSRCTIVQVSVAWPNGTSTAKGASRRRRRCTGRHPPATPRCPEGARPPRASHPEDVVVQVQESTCAVFITNDTSFLIIGYVTPRRRRRGERDVGPGSQPRQSAIVNSCLSTLSARFAASVAFRGHSKEVIRLPPSIYA